MPKKQKQANNTEKKEQLPGEVILPFKIPKLVKILWVDAYTIGGEDWIERDVAKSYAKEPLPHMLTVGFVLFMDNEQVAVTSTIGPGETAQVNKIPKRMIIKMDTIQ